MKYLAALFILASALCVQASDLITATVTVTNVTTDGLTFTVNSSVRTFKSSVTVPSTQVAISSDVTGNTSKTNLFNQISLNPFSSHIALFNIGTNSFQLQGDCGTPLTVTASGTYASVTYATQACATATSVGVPFSSYYALLAARTNTASQLAIDIDNYDTNRTLLDLANAQTITGKKTFNNTNGFFGGLVTSLAFSGNIVFTTNGVFFLPVLMGPTLSNGVNVGNPFSSPGLNANDEQFGRLARAQGTNSLAVGVNSSALALSSVAIGLNAGVDTPGYFSVAIGANAVCEDLSSIAIGIGSSTSFSNSIAIGSFTSVNGIDGIAIGKNVDVEHTNAVAIGNFAATTAPNQIMLGSPGVSTVVQNDLNVQTNAVIGGNISVGGVISNPEFSGFTTFTNNTDIAFVRKSVSSLANGNNAAVPIGTNVFIEVSGPSGSFAINGIANGRDGKLITILNQSGFQMTIANESGTDPTAANRIRTLGSATDLVLTNAAVNLIYNGSVSRWIVISHNP